MLTTTLLKLKEHKACERGYDLIAAHVGAKFKGDIPLETILTNNGLKDCIWALRTCNAGNTVAIEFSIRVAMLICTDVVWIKWADSWLDNSDRSKDAAYAAYVTYNKSNNSTDLTNSAAYIAYATHTAYATYPVLAAYAANLAYANHVNHINSDAAVEILRTLIN